MPWEEREGSLFVDDPDGRPVQVMPYRAPETETDRWPQHARPSTTVHLGGAAQARATSTASRATSRPASASTPRCSGMRLSDWLDEAGVWFHINSDHHVMALVDLGYAHFHHLAFETVDIGKMRDMLDHLARHGRWLGWGPTRHGIAGNIASYVRIVEEECFVELYCDMEQLQDGPRAARLPRRPLLVEHVGAAAAALVLPLRPGRDRVRAGEPRDPRAQPAAAGARVVPLTGYTIPRSPSGRSSLVPYPPWHYIGDFLVVEYWADPDKAVSVLPQGLDPHPDAGRCALVFADWQSCSGSGGELVDPSRSQYKECFMVVNALLDGEEVTTCPFIWVDRDFALTRGWLQGFPKKLGSIWVTRTFGLDSPADPGVKAGATFGGTCSAYERRVAEATVTLERLSETGPTHNDPPIVNVRHFARLEAGRHDEPAVHELARSRSRDRVISPIWEGSATLELFGSDHEEHDLLAPVRVGKGFRFTFGVHGRRPGDREGHPRVTRVALVTGGGTGIGAAVARRLAADGYDVCVTGRRPGPIRDVAAEVGGLAIVADTGVEADAERAVGEAVEHFGGLDALVLNAGIGGEGSLVDMAPAVFEDVFRVNVTGAFLMARAAISHLHERRGAIVSIASAAALRAAPSSLAYCSSKAALAMLTQCIALDHGPDGVRANCVCPGWVRTPMADDEMDALGLPLARGGLRDRDAGRAAPPAEHAGGDRRDGGVAALRRRVLRERRGDPRRRRAHDGRRRHPGLREDGVSDRITVAGVEVSPDHYIGGQRYASESTFTDLSPIDEQPLGEIARGGRARGRRGGRRRDRGASRPGPPCGAAGRRAVPPSPRRPDRRERRAPRAGRVRRHGDAAALAEGAADQPGRAQLPQPTPTSPTAYEERVWDSNGTHNRVIRMPAGPGGRDHARGTRRSCSRPGRRRPRSPPAAR